MQRWLIGATDRDRLSAMFQLYNILAAFFVFSADKGDILKIDDIRRMHAAEVFPKLLHQFFHSEAERVGGAIFFMDDDVVILGFKIKDLITAQTHTLMTVLKCKYLTALCQYFFKRATASSSAASVTGLCKNQTPLNLNHSSIN